jgi:glycosyl transferase family 87
MEHSGVEHQESVEERGAVQIQHAKPDTRPSKLARLLLILLLIGIVGGWAYVVFSAAQLTPPRATDFAVYYAAATLLRHNPHGDIYSVAALQNAAATYGGCAQPRLFNYVYPSLLAIVMEPLTYLTCAQAFAVWTVFTAIVWALSAVILVDLLRTRWPESQLGLWALVIAGLVSFLPTYLGLYLGQTHLLLLFCLSLGIWLERNERPWLAGAVIVFAALTRPLPALLLVYYARQKRWSVLGGALIAGMLLVIVMLLGSGPITVMRSIPVALSSPGSASQSGLDEALSVVAGQYGVALVLLVVCAYLAAIIFQRSGDTTLGAAWTLCTMLAVSPYVWSFYLVWLLPTHAILLGNGRSLTRYRSAFYVALALVYVNLVNPYWQLGRALALLALWCLCGALYWRSKQSPNLEARL